VLEESVQKG